jgi:D-serine deaminase-like pyridoxal phosphate-dependent protein
MSLVGKPLDQLDTPALWVDLDGMERNIDHFSQYFRQANVAWRPHTKGIKIPAIAQRLMRAGAIGVTCAKLSEAEVMVAGGIQDILIANQVVGREKALRLAYLNRRANVKAAVDSLENAGQLSQAAQQAGVRIQVLVELETGMERSGIAPGETAVPFAQQVAALPGLELLGLMSWEGHVCRIQDAEQKRAAVSQSVGALVDTAERCRQAGLPISIVSCRGTGSYRYSAQIAGVTEMQAGGGIFGDLTYASWGAEMECSLFVLVTVTSHTRPERAIVDAGRKAINTEYALPKVWDRPGIEVVKCTAEHGILKLEPGRADVRVGEKLSLIVGYEDLTVFLHDCLYGVRGGIVEVAWNIQGRGKLS